MPNPFELFSNKHDSGLFVDTSKAHMQLDQLPLRSVDSLHASGAQTMQRRLSWVGIGVVIIFGVLLGRLLFLQAWQGNELRAVAEGNRLREQIITSSRGVFFDSQGKQLVENIPDFSIVLVPRDLPRDVDQRAQVIQDIASMIGISNEELTAVVKKTSLAVPSVTLKDHVAYTEAVERMVEFQSIPGVRVETGFRRTYTDGAAWSNILGYMGKITADEWQNLQQQDKNYPFDALIGKTGLEYSYEQKLKGTDGKRVYEVNASGKEQSVLSSTDPIPGQNIQLSIDSGLQHVAQDSLDKMVEAQHSPGGAAIVTDVNTGEILSLVSSPTFDNELFGRGITADEFKQLLEDERHPLLNRPIAGEYPSGSTFKPVVASAGLAEQVITPSTTVLSVGGIDINGSFFPDWKAGGHGLTDVRKALADSVNTFFYLLGGGDNKTTSGLGVDRIVAYAKKFGLASQLGIDLPGEHTGFLPSKNWKEETKNELWYIGDTYHLAIGQGDILVTPLQIASYTATIANGGTIWKPHIAKTFLSQDGSMRQDNAPEAMTEHVVEDKYLQVVREGMRQAVTSGSARALGSMPWALAAKTGTAQHAGSDIPHAWITVFGPYEKPQISVTVLVEEGGEGTTAALPVARDILNYYISQQSSRAGG